MITNDLELVDFVNDIINQVEDNVSKLDLNGSSLQFREKFLDSDTSVDSSSDSSTVSSDSEPDLQKFRKKQITRMKPLINNESDDDDEDDEDLEEKKIKKTQKYLKTKGELTIDDLQPVSRLNINIDNEIKLIKMGKVLSIVDDKLVVIQSLMDEQVKPLDEETILFDSNRKCLGKIFEIFGPVTSPFYSIRFNSSKDIKENELNVEKDAFVYYAPDSQDLTKFIFNVDELRQLKGSDASWNHDNEPPVEHLDYSDDEKEQQAKKQAKQQNRKIAENLDAYDDSDESETTNTDSTTANNKKFRNNNNRYNKMTKSRSSNFNLINNRNNRPHPPYMSQSRSEYNFTPNQQYHPSTSQQQIIPNQFMGVPPPFYGYPPHQSFYPTNQFMNYPPQMPYFPPGFNFMPPPIPPPQQQQQQHQQYHFNNFQQQNNSNNSSPSKLVDKRFVQNNLVKKSF